MAITDLTGTKWVINQSPNVSTPFYYTISFTSDGYWYGGLQVSTLASVTWVRYWWPAGEDWDSAYSPEDGGWRSQAYRLISITGGTDATNIDLIAWLETNATQVQVDDLTDTVWEIVSNPIVQGYGHYDIDFTVGSEEYDTIALGYSHASHHGGGGWTPANENWYTMGADAGDPIEIGDVLTITGGADSEDPDLIVWLTNNATLQEPIPVTTFDLSTLGLSAGTHAIQVKARATDYGDSIFSNSVSYVVQSTLISFSIEGTTYQAEEGMTWAELVDSEYNIYGYSVENGHIYNGHDGYVAGVSSNDQIVPNQTYSIEHSGG